MVLSFFQKNAEAPLQGYMTFEAKSWDCIKALESRFLVGHFQIEFDQEVHLESTEVVIKKLIIDFETQ